jgi:DNA-binding NarL/FixJ family response regulator
VLADIQMQIVNGHQASHIISKKLSFISVIALTMFFDADRIFKMFEADAKGYVTKNAEIDEIAKAVNTVSLGDMY